LSTKGITWVAVFAGVMGLLAALVSFVATVQTAASNTASGGTTDTALGLVALAFVTICLLGVCAASALRSQTDEIAILRRQLIEARRG